MSRTIFGARVSVAMGLVAVTISVVGGSVLGRMAGYFRSVTDMLVSRLVDVMLGFPGILLALVALAILSTNLPNAIIAGSALSFLRLGIKPPTADWCEMPSNGRSLMARQLEPAGAGRGHPHRAE